MEQRERNEVDGKCHSKTNLTGQESEGRRDSTHRSEKEMVQIFKGSGSWFQSPEANVYKVSLSRESGTTGLLPNHIQHRVDELGILSIMTLRPIVSRTSLAENKVVGPEQLPEGPHTNTIHGSRSKSMRIARGT